MFMNNVKRLGNGYENGNTGNFKRFQRERAFLEAVQSGNMVAVRSKLRDKSSFDINCEDRNGRNALSLAITNGQLDIIRLLLKHDIEIGDALLRAVDVNNVNAVEILCKYAGARKNKNLDIINASADNQDFPPGQTPLILAAHRNSFDICKILLEYGAILEDPNTLSETHGLQRSLGELQIYKALASQAYICYTSKDPIKTAFELSYRLRNMSKTDVEFGPEYDKLEEECEAFAAALLAHTRSEYEITTVLTHDPEEWAKSDTVDTVKPHKAALAVKYYQKKFVADPSFQQLMYNRWYRGLLGWGKWSFMKRCLFTIAIMFVYPFLSLFYIIYPFRSLDQLLHVPYVKFLMSTASSLAFLSLIVLVLLQVELWPLVGYAAFQPTSSVNPADALAFLEQMDQGRGRAPTPTECLMLIFVIAMAWREFKEVWTSGFREYCRDVWNLLDIIQLALYFISAAFFLYAMVIASMQKPDIVFPNNTSWWNLTVANNTLQDLLDTVIHDSVINKEISPSTVQQFVTSVTEKANAQFYIAADNDQTRNSWPGNDPNLISEGLFALANIVSFLRLINIMVINRHVGPLQISLWGMFYDIGKFLCIFFLMLLAFAIGLTQLYKFNASDASYECMIEDPDKAYTCTNAFDGLIQTIRTLYWSLFGMINLETLQVEANHSFTVTVAESRMVSTTCWHHRTSHALIAMMSNTYTRVEENADSEWKFHRTRMWMGYFENTATLPPPFNIIPSTKAIKQAICCRCLREKKIKHNSEIIAELQAQYEDVVRQLTLRYISDRRSEVDEEGGPQLTHADIMQLKQDMSSFRYDISTGINKVNDSMKKMRMRINKLSQKPVPNLDSIPYIDADVNPDGNADPVNPAVKTKPMNPDSEDTDSPDEYGEETEYQWESGI
ncbi:short transient receptor potential channel 5-like [Saccoglossus kowalevskii]|uniref:Short transient receptor potential channel 5-like n=1 Tax=Saccoglossus kowalevskii TaxID=10224 RepID=A0ABM0GYM8_SACKO|nr:PREDICTED: short transient receptor potential channel 5-like [Saccoglossus kowalevskii]